MRALSLAALILGVLLIPTALGIARQEHEREVSQLERTLAAEADEHALGLKTYFDRARSVILLTANAPAFANALAAPGGRAEVLRANGRGIREIVHHLAYLQTLYPNNIGEACLIDSNGDEWARVVRGEIAQNSDLSTVEDQSVFFAPTLALRFGQVHQSLPYTSADTREWVMANAALIPQTDGRRRAFAHFEITIESVRRAMGTASGLDLRIIDGSTGRVVIEGTRPQLVGAPLGVPNDRRFAGLARSGGTEGTADLDGRRLAYRQVPVTTGNANDWIIVATARTPTGTVLSTMGAAPISMLALALVMVTVAGIALRTVGRELEAHANTDSLTGLGNRRRLMADLERRTRSVTADEPFVLTMFDLNGFKNYNDSFGHPAGDALLQRLGLALAGAIAPFTGRAYRPGGDEFCVIADAKHQVAMEHAACRALSEQGEGFAVSTAFGSVVVPRDTRVVSEALRGADMAMYALKHSGRATAGHESSDVLAGALAERHPELAEHLDSVASLAVLVGERLGIKGDELADLRRAAALHDIGKVGVPDAIIAKPGPLTDQEWAFMRRHPLIGERILSAAPSLNRAARLVRSSHEAWNGTGYPDGLAGADIPLGARIIAVCSAFEAMTSARSYAPAATTDNALAELWSSAGTRFDPAIVGVAEQVLVDRAVLPAEAPVG